MSEVIFTKGPWTRDDNDGYSINRIFADARGHHAIAEVIGDDAETEANAHLIAAAPTPQPGDVPASSAPAPDPLSPARVEAMAREYCRIMGLDPDAMVSADSGHGPEIVPLCLVYFGKDREFIAMMLAYEGTKG